jgi:hypothetical protein
MVGRFIMRSWKQWWLGQQYYRHDLYLSDLQRFDLALYFKHEDIIERMSREAATSSLQCLLDLAKKHNRNDIVRNINFRLSPWK